MNAQRRSRRTLLLAVALLVAPASALAQQPGQTAPDTRPRLEAKDEKSKATEDDHGPSLDETLTWLRGQFAAHGAYAFCEPLGGGAWAGHTYETTLDSFDGCTIEVTVRDRGTFQDGGARPQTRVYQIAIPLRDINGSDITVKPTQGCDTGITEYVVTLSTYTGSRTMKVHYTCTAQTDTGAEVLVKDDRLTWSSLSFGLLERDVADRLVRGFSHAVKLCGGKESPF